MAVKAKRGSAVPPVAVDNPTPIEPIVEETSSVAVSIVVHKYQNFYTGYALNNLEIGELEECAEQIERLRNETIESMASIGSYLLKAKRILGDDVTFKKGKGNSTKPERGTFVQWTQSRICEPLNISYDTARRWLGIAQELEDFPEQKEQILGMLPTALYETIRPSFPADLKEIIYAEDAVRLNTDQIKTIRKLHQTVNAQERNITAKAIVTLGQSSLLLSNTALKQLSQLNVCEQPEYAAALVNNRELGLEALRERVKELKIAEGLEEIAHKNSPDGKLAIVDTTLDALKPETLDLILVECPLGAAWKDSTFGLKHLTDRLEEVLVPGGMAMVFLGHTTIMSVSSYITNLKPLTLLTCRRQPGNSTTSIGINVGYASVHAALIYKPPFRPPSKIVFDIQTFQETEQLAPELAEVPTGIEAGIAKFLNALVSPGYHVGHLVVGNRSYGLRPELEDELSKLKANTFYKL